MALGSDPTKTYKVADNASSTLASGISSGSTIISLNGGDGALFPTTYNGSATSAGDSTTLNSTGIGATGVAAGDQIYNVTDGSWATIITVSTNSVTTTALRGGSGNTWDNTDEWVVHPFIITMVQYTTTGDESTAVVKREKALVKYRSTDDLYIATRGFDSTTATAFDSGDNVYGFVEKATIETINAALRQIQYEIERTVTTDGARYLDNNTYLKASDNAGTGSVDIIKVDTSDELQLGQKLKNPSARTISGDYELIDKKYFDDNGANSYTVTYGETIAIGEVLYYDTSAGKWLKADANDTSKVRAQALALQAGVDTDSKLVQMTGVVSGLTGLTAGSMYYLSDTAGAMSTTPSTTTLVPIGRAISTTELLLTWGSKTSRGSGTDQSQSTNTTITETITLGFRPKMVNLTAKTTYGDGVSMFEGGTPGAGSTDSEGGIGFSTDTSDNAFVNQSGLASRDRCINASGANGQIYIFVSSFTDTGFVISYDFDATGTIDVTDVEWIAIGD